MARHLFSQMNIMFKFVLLGLYNLGARDIIVPGCRVGFFVVFVGGVSCFCLFVVIPFAKSIFCLSH